MAREWTDERINEVFPLVFERLEDGEALVAILESDKALFPAPRVFLEKVEKSEKLSKQYAQAREIAAMRDYLAIENLAREPFLFTETKEGESDKGAYSERKTIDNVQRSRLIIDSIKWRHAHTFKMLNNKNAAKKDDDDDYDGDYEDLYE